MKIDKEAALRKIALADAATKLFFGKETLVADFI